MILRLSGFVVFCWNDRMKTLSVLLLGLWSLASGAPPVVSNIRAAQRPGTKLVDIYYDLSDADGDLQLVQVAASSDAGLTYGIPCVSLSGHVGAGISLGANRKITWNAGADWNGNWVPQCRVRVTAHDGTTPPAPPGMAYIPGGPFQMGDNLDGMTDAMPVHNVQVDAFFMDKTEVTKELWQSVQTWGNANGYLIGGSSFKDTGHPVEGLNWFEAVKWCNARSQKEGLTPCYYTDAAQTDIYKVGNVNVLNTMVKWTASGYRLPTEAEWEKAARGGATGLRYPWGNSITTYDANYYASGNPWQTGSQPWTCLVVSYPENGYGIFNIAGNVWELTWDLYSSTYYGTADSITNPYGPTSGANRVVRGGSWDRDSSGCRSAYRNNSSPYDYYSKHFGIRTVRR
jgi:formylglycine-generating enzyme required for sulfatase activity